MADKKDRIEKLIEDMKAGRLSFAQGSRELLDEIDRYAQEQVDLGRLPRRKLQEAR